MSGASLRRDCSIGRAWMSNTCTRRDALVLLKDRSRRRGYLTQVTFNTKKQRFCQPADSEALGDPMDNIFIINLTLISIGPK